MGIVRPDIVFQGIDLQENDPYMTGVMLMNGSLGCMWMVKNHIWHY